MIEPTCVRFRKLRKGVNPVRLTRYENSGENLKLEKVANGKYQKTDINFEYTGAGTSSRNYLVELGFAMIVSRGRDSMQHVNVPTNIRYILYKQAYRTATMLNELTVIDIDRNQATRYENFYSSKPEFATKFSSWG